MRNYGSMHPTELIELPADTVFTFLMTGGSSAQSADWPTSAAAAAANASSAGINLVRFTGQTSAGAQLGYMVNMISTHANVPTSGSSVTTGTSAGSTGNSFPVFGARTLQVPMFSTGFSVASFTSGYIIAEMWHK